MFEVVLTNGDRAEADSPESIIFAAITLIDEAITNNFPAPKASFYYDGKLVRYECTEVEVKGSSVIMRRQEKSK